PSRRWSSSDPSSGRGRIGPRGPPGNGTLAVRVAERAARGSRTRPRGRATPPCPPPSGSQRWYTLKHRPSSPRRGSRGKRASRTRSTGARKPRIADTRTPRTQATSHHHAGVAERSQRTTLPTTIEPPRPRPTDLARSFAHPRNDCDESPEVVSHRCPPTYAKGSSTARKMRNSRTRNRI